MGKKKRNQPDLDEILARPWCYYCERDFDDLKVLISHQKAKHFKCDRCGRRLGTAGGLSVHMTQVHKESLTTIENALPNRAGLEVEIFGMEGIPEDIVIAHRQRVATQFVQAGNQPIQNNVNPAAGGTGPNPAKKPKLETGSDLKKKLAEHRARKAAEEAGTTNGGSPAVETPVAQSSTAQPAFAGPPPGFTPPQFTAPFSAPSAHMPMNTGPGFNGYPQYGQPSAQFQPPQTFASPPIQFGQQPFQPPFQSPQGAYAPPSQYQTGPPNLPSRGYGSNSPDMQYQISQAPPLGIPARPVGLSPAPGLPQRPAFGAPSVNAFQLQQMHQGHVPTQPVPHADQAKPVNGTTMPTHANAVTTSAVEVSTAPPLQQQVQPTQAPEQPAKTEAKAADVVAEKKGKKDKDKEARLVYSDNEVSPEEKLSKLARYAFDPSQRTAALVGTVSA